MLPWALLLACAPLGAGAAVDEAACGSTKGCWRSGDALVTWAPSGDHIAFELSHKVTASEYLALGFSTDASMGSDLVVWCNAANSNLASGYNGGGYAPTTPADPAYAAAETLWQEGQLSCSFSLPKSFAVAGLDAVSSLQQHLHLLVAKGPSTGGALSAKHTERRFSDEPFNLTDDSAFQSVLSNSFAANLRLILAHGGLMVFGWLVCLSTSVLLARFFKKTLEGEVAGAALWFRLHQGLNALGLLAVVVAAVLIFTANDWKWSGPRSNSSMSVSEAHSLVGLFAVVLGLVQPLNAAVRPAKDAKSRAAWRYVHLATGLGAWLCAMVAVGLGSRLAVLSGPHGDAPLAAILVFYVAFGVAFVGLSVWRCVAEGSGGAAKALLALQVLVSLGVFVAMAVFLANAAP